MATLRLTGSGVNAVGGSAGEGAEGEVCLFLHHLPRMPGILPTHGPRAVGEAFGIGLDGIELVVL